MSEFANPAGSAAASAAQYVESLLALLGDQEPFEVMEGLHTALEAAVRGMDDAALRRPEAEGKWSAIEVLAHLADTELVYGYRVRMILSSPTPAIEGYDQDVWARTLRYREADLAEVLATIRALRRANLRLLRALSQSELDREGKHQERGRESVRKILHMMAAHDLVHRRQLERIRSAVAGKARA